MKNLRRILLLSLVAVSLGVWFWLRWLEQSYDPPYCRVEDGLFIGGSINQPPPGTQAVVNLCGRKDPYQINASLWEPIFEGEKEPDLAWLHRVVAFIAEQRNAGRTTYVHCFSGMNRSGAVVTAYLMSKHGWNRETALTFLQEKRPVVQPNPQLMRLLAEWETAMREKRDSG